VGIGALLLGGALILLWVRLHHGSLKLAREIAEAPERPVSRDRARLEPRAEMGPAQSVDR
jgi:hypothetical protein